MKIRRLLPAALLVLGNAAHGAPEAAGADPRTFPPADIGKFASALPSYTRLGISGIAFLGDRLYVGTNVGLVEVSGRETVALHRWEGGGNAGPWADPPRGAVWLQLYPRATLVRRDSRGWRSAAVPLPRDLGVNRGDALEGFTGASDARQFRIAGARNSWHWDDAAGWVLEPRPAVDRMGGVVRVARAGDRRLSIVRKGGLACVPACESFAYWRDGDRWSEPIPVPLGRFPAEVVSTADAVFFRNDRGELYRIGAAAAERVETPAPCEALAVDPRGRLLASFRGAGIFALDAKWTKLFDSPYPATEGAHRAYLAAGDSAIAFATTSEELRPAQGAEVRWTGTDALWVSAGKALARVPLR